MNYDLEMRLRSEAASLRRNGVLTWDAALRASGLDPHQWSDGAPTGIAVHAGAARSFGPGLTLHRAAPLAASSFDASDNSIECTWSTGAAVLRSDWDETFSEVLDMAPKAVRLGRLNAGAPFLNSHQSNTLGMVLGSVVRGSASIARGKGICRIALSTADENAGLIRDIKGGVIRNVSVGYVIHATNRTDATPDGIPVIRVTDWEPIEISAVAIPADAGAQIN